MMGTFKTMHMLASSANHTNVFFDCIGGDSTLVAAVSILRLSKIYESGCIVVITDLFFSKQNVKHSKTGNS